MSELNNASPSACIDTTPHYHYILLHFRQIHGNATDLAVLFEGKDPSNRVLFLHYIVLKGSTTWKGHVL